MVVCSMYGVSGVHVWCGMYLSVWYVWWYVVCMVVFVMHGSVGYVWCRVVCMVMCGIYGVMWYL